MANPFKLARAALFGKHKLIPRQFETSTARAKMVRTLGSALVEGVKGGSKALWRIKVTNYRKFTPAERWIPEVGRAALRSAKREFAPPIPRGPRTRMTAGIGPQGKTVWGQVKRSYASSTDPNEADHLYGGLRWWQRAVIRRGAGLTAGVGIAEGLSHREVKEGSGASLSVGPVGVHVGHRVVHTQTPKGMGHRGGISAGVTWKETPVLDIKGGIGQGKAKGFGRAHKGELAVRVHVPLAKFPINAGFGFEGDKQFTEKRRTKRLQKLRQTVMGELPIPRRY